VKTVLVKIHPGDKDMGFGEHIRLRKWCYKNIACEWGSFFLDRPDEILPRHAAFQFESKNEAMKFKLYSG